MVFRDKSIVVVHIFIILLLSHQKAEGKNSEAGTKNGERNYISYTVNDKSWLSLTGTTNVNTFECLSGSGLSNGYIMAEANFHQNTINLADARILVEVSSFKERDF